MPNSFIAMDSIKRIRTDPAIVAYGLYLYFNSRSYIDLHASLWNQLQRELM
jgi:hypothetical protein